MTMRLTAAVPCGRPDAHIVADDAEALAIAAALAAQFAPEAAERDAERRLPGRELDRLSESGLLGITVPRAFGGADVRARTLAEVFRRLAAADPSIAQIPHSHVVYVDVLRQQGSPRQQEFFFGEVLAGKRFGNAQPEAGPGHARDQRIRLLPGVCGGFLISGVRRYSTGALFADWIPVPARGQDDRLYVAYVPWGAPGLAVIDDWAGMGQRTTASGTVRLDDVPVPAERVVPHHLTFEGPQLHGALAQLLHAAIDVGIAGGALAEAVRFVRTGARAWPESGIDTAAEDPLVVQRVGELAVRVRAAEALLDAAGRSVDEARTELTDASAGAASMAVAAAKAFAEPVAVELGSAIFELGGTRSSQEGLNLNRYWRDARTHTLHDPARWKIQHIGRYVLNGQLPPRYGPR
jgi:SfnB family sulfur acquisition oxidoreductase